MSGISTSATARELLAGAGIEIGQPFDALQPAQLAAIQAAADARRQHKYGSVRATASPTMMRRFYELAQIRAQRRRCFAQVRRRSTAF